MRAIERRASTDSDLHIVQPVSLAAVVMDATSRHDAKLQGLGDVDQRSGQGQITPHAIALQLDEESVSSELFPTAFGAPARRREPFGFEGPRQQSALPATREHDQPILTRGERIEREPRVEAIGAEVSLREQPAEVGVSLRRLGEQREVRSVGERHLGAGDRLETERLRRLRERHRAVQAVAIGEGEGLIAELVGGRDEILGERGTVEKRESGVAVQLGVHGRGA